ncbi:MAG: hypothetical protein HOV94_05380 [Saccharothrix sp.]|nr:hypothetical protein [Saccharothrix sp.]
MTDHTPEPIQLDLFEDVETIRRRRLLDALTCLRDVVPTTLEILVDLDRDHSVDTDTRQPHAAGEWANCVGRDGVRVESRHEWWTLAQARRGEPWGWDRTPAHLTTWAQLRALIGDDPRRAELAAWVASLPEHGRWQWTHRPHELGPGAAGMHHSHIDADHRDPLWQRRLAAWVTTLDIVDDAIRAAGGER